jgi:CPA1 family monovalent cation:H+ antiporter
MSGVLAVVTTGLFIARKSPEAFSYQARMRSRVLWDTLIFLLQGFVFIMIGLQLPSIIEDMGRYPMEKIIGYGLTISLVTILVRIIWVFSGAQWLNMFSKKKKNAGDSTKEIPPDETWKNVLVVAWTGTRGVISLAAALALPLVLLDGTAFPKRSSIIFLAFVVIFVTLVVQGLSLPLLIRWLKIRSNDNTDEEAKELQLYLANSTIHFIEKELPVAGDNKLQQQLKTQYEQIIRKLTKEINLHRKAKYNNHIVQASEPDNLLQAQIEINKFQRSLLLKLHEDGQFSDEALRHTEREMDIDALKIDQQLPKETPEE